jgi:aryl-phospho-beta-D-glucosidase BglC (GH1 family)
MWNVESYMINVNSPDVKGMGESKLRAALVAGMGQAATDTFFATWEANIVAASDVALWASWGVNSVRVPINYHMISTADGAYIDAGFQKIDAFVALCKAQNIYVILDLHAAPGAQNCEQMSDSPDGVAHLWSEPAMYRQWTIDLWQTIAKRYASETAVGGFDIFDEPYDTESNGSFSTGDGTLRQMYLDLTTAIRAVDPNHIIFFEGTNWSSDDGSTHGFAGLQPPWDPQMAWSFHKYWDANTTAAIQPYLDLRTSSNRPVWNGETGEDTSSGWSGAMIKLLEANKIGWNEWTYKKVAQSANFYSITQPASWSATATYIANFAANGSGTAPSDLNATMTELANNAATSKCALQSAWLKEVFNK